MRGLALLLSSMCCFAFGSTAPEPGPTTVVQGLFDAMSTHDVQAARGLFTSDAMLITLRPDGSAVSIPYEKWLEHLGTSKDKWLERIWDTKVLEHGSIAVVWGDYDFHLNGNFSHCGVDSFDLVKTQAGWKIAGIMFTTEKTGCAPSPLGPPKK